MLPLSPASPRRFAARSASTVKGLGAGAGADSEGTMERRTRHTPRSISIYIDLHVDETLMGKLSDSPKSSWWGCCLESAQKLTSAEDDFALVFIPGLGKCQWQWSGERWDQAPVPGGVTAQWTVRARALADKSEAGCSFLQGVLNPLSNFEELLPCQKRFKIASYSSFSKSNSLKGWVYCANFVSRWILIWITTTNFC